MKALKTVFGSLAAIAMLAMPSPALAEYLIPPGNSAATQYTEAYPTGGGNRSTEPSGKTRSPAEVVGEQNARSLESRGPAGRATADAAAATAPSGGLAVSTDGPGNGGGAKGSGGQTDPGTADLGSTAGAAVEGSSGFGEVVAEATGSSSDGELGLLLPLAIAAAVAWALAYLWRQRKRQTA